MNNKKDSIQGKKITKKEAMKGLGNPKTWKKFKKQLDKEFKQKPLNNV